MTKICSDQLPSGYERILAITLRVAVIFPRVCFPFVVGNNQTSKWIPQYRTWCPWGKNETSTDPNITCNCFSNIKQFKFDVMISLSNNETFKNSSMLSRRQLPLNSLRSFEVTARHLQMGRAADELGVTQGAVSQQIKSLEEHLGVALFERNGNRLRLTPAGVHLLPILRESFDRIAFEASNLNPEQLEGELLIGCTASALSNWLLNSLPSFWKMYPNIKLNFEIIDKLQTQLPVDIDISICYGQPDVAKQRLKRLVHYTIFPVCSPSYLNKREQPLIKPKHLSSCTLLLDDQGEEWERWAQFMNVDISQITDRLSLSMHLLAIQACKLGLGVALVNQLEVADDLANGSLVSIYKEASHKALHPYFIVTPPSQQLNIRTEVFIKWLSKLFQDV